MPRYLFNQSRRREIAQQLALQERINFRFEKTIARQLSITMRSAISQFEKDENDFGVEAVIKERQPMLQNALAADWKLAMDTFGQRILNVLKNSGHFQVKQIDPGDYFEEAVDRYIRTWTASAAKDITQTTTKQLRTLIADGVEEGLSAVQIGREIRKKIPNLSLVRARTIARTETHTASSIGAHIAAEATGLPLRKEWIAVTDDRSRDGHLDLDGTIIGMHEKFTVVNDATGDVDEMDYPGDPTATPGNIINCRCMVGYVEAE